jgi:hypothetical protein
MICCTVRTTPTRGQNDLTTINALYAAECKSCMTPYMATRVPRATAMATIAVPKPLLRSALLFAGVGVGDDERIGAELETVGTAVDSDSTSVL